MKKITKVQKITALALLLLVVSIVGYVFLYQHINVLRVELDEINADLAVIDEFTQNKQATVSLLSDTEQDRKELNRYLVPADDPTSFLDLIEELEQDTGIIISTESVLIAKPDNKEEGAEDSQKKINVVLAVEGDWQGIYHLLSLLETLPHAACITKVGLSVNKKDDSGAWGGQIHLQGNTI